MPAERCGNARILIIAAEMTYWGIRFTEVSSVQKYMERPFAFRLQSAESHVV